MAVSEAASVPVKGQEAPRTQRPQTPPITWWAILGGICLAFAIYLFVAWVTGPYFKEVPSGPGEPPTWMKTVLTLWQILGVPAALGLLYWFLLRPWIAERRVTFDGLLCLSCLLVVWQDPLSSYFTHWYTYNSWMINRGSWVQEVPGWMSFGQPGAMEVEPIIWTPFMYVYVFFLGAVIGCWAMRKASERKPHWGNLKLILVCFFTMAIFDFIVEGCLIIPAGVYTYAGGHLAIFPDSYHKFPLTEMVTAGGVWTGLAVLRFFKDDQGRTMVERGVDKLNISDGRKNLVRFLAIFGMCNFILMFAYNIPNGVLGANSTSWPKDIQERSYLTDYLCGPGTVRACPGDNVPITRTSDGPHIGRDGQVVNRDKIPTPPVTEFTDGKRGAFRGGLFGE